MTEYLIATSVLESIVRGSLEGDDRLHLHSGIRLARSHPVEVTVDGDQCHVTVHLDARMGEVLPALASEARQKIVGALSPMTGLAVLGVDVVFAGVLPAAN
ncbi:MAG: hypothetical protein GX630_04795 [Actinobacteria bacterium]|nr:hypothetical protein [Actinomycetota bacterium]